MVIAQKPLGQGESAICYFKSYLKPKIECVFSHAQPHGKRFTTWSRKYVLYVKEANLIPNLSQLLTFRPKQLKNQALWFPHTHKAHFWEQRLPLFPSMLTMLLPKILLHPSIVATCLPGGKRDSLVICSTADSAESLFWLVEYASWLTGFSEALTKT